MREIKPTFEVDKAGLAKLLERKGKHFAVAELIQNAWDEDVSNVAVVLKPKGHGLYLLQVADDSPEGFADLRHAYTLFAESAKKDDPEKRGRFNLGEKLVVALCEMATIETTTGKIEWQTDGRTFDSDQKTPAGSVFSGLLKLSDAEAKEVERVVHSLIPPVGIVTVFNGVNIAHRQPVKQFRISLRTERADAEGYLRPTTRKTTVSVYEPKEGEIGQLYELGIPVVESGDRYHVDIGQKVPLNTDRDNVPPGFLRDVRAAVLNAMHSELSPETASEKWIDDALEDETVAPEAVQAVVTARYGKKVVTADPSDREAEKIAVSKGYTVIPAGAFSKPAWSAVKGAVAAKPAGQVTPSPNPNAGEDELAIMDPEHWPDYVKGFVAYSKELAQRVLDVEITVRVVQPKRSSEWPYNATWGRRGSRQAELTLNYTALGYGFFEKAMGTEHLSPLVHARAHELLIHEFAHQYASEHLSEAFYEACCKVGAKLAEVLADQPNLKRVVLDGLEVAA